MTFIHPVDDDNLTVSVSTTSVGETRRRRSSFWMAILRNNIRRFRRKLCSTNGKPLAGLLACVILIGLFNLAIRSLSPPKVDKLVFTTPVDDPSINWTKVAHVQYVTSPEDLCKAVMLFSELMEASSLALRVLFYPSDWSIKASENSRGGSFARLLNYAADEFSVVLRPIDILRQDFPDGGIWRPPHTRLLAYNLTQYDRVITLDGSSTVLNSMDELFFLDPTPLAMPLVYWGKPRGWRLSDNIIVIQPSSKEFTKIVETVKTVAEGDLDVNVMDLLYNETLVKLPQRPYHLLTDEFHRWNNDHTRYLGKAMWDAARILRETKLVHFHDAQVPDPWIASDITIQKHIPRCIPNQYRRQDCSNRLAWSKLYSDYTYRRKNVCGPGFEPSTEDTLNKA